jgi:hypothetical protein
MPAMRPMRLEPPTTNALGAALATAAALSFQQRDRVMVPEALLLALLCDPAIDPGDGAPAEEPALLALVRGSDERPDRDGWSARAKEAYHRG